MNQNFMLILKMDVLSSKASEFLVKNPVFCLYIAKF